LAGIEWCNRKDTRLRREINLKKNIVDRGHENEWVMHSNSDVEIIILSKRNRV
jgi:hypothetical protein